MKKMTRLSALVLSTSLFALAACGSGSTAEEANGDKTIEWWHIQVQEPQRSVWADAAKAFEEANPGVTIEINVQTDVDFKTGLDARMQAGDPPEIYQSWGGGGLQNQIDAGLVKDLTEPTKDWINTLAPSTTSAMNIDGKQWAVPYDAGLVGFWYNKDLFAQVGIDAPPTTWTEFLADVSALKAGGITPIAVGAGDKWPAMFYWAELALRTAGPDKLLEVAETGAFDAPEFVEAGKILEELIALEPFQEGFLGAAYADATGGASHTANGKAAMELQGSWSPGTQASVAENGEGLGDSLAWFPFPAIEGAAQTGSTGFGGVNAFAVAKDAPAEAVEFLEYLTSEEVQRKMAEAGQLLPVIPEVKDAVANPHQRAILEQVHNIDRIQIFLDQAYAPVVANAINDNVQGLFAGSLTAEQVAQNIAASAK